MRKSYIYFLMAIIFPAALAPSCERVETPPVEEEEQTGELIRIEAQGSDMRTRGLLGSNDLPQEGTTVKVYDYLTGFTGKINNQSYTNGSVMYIDDAVTYGADGNWKFSNYDWRWTRTGTHHFYGWLTKDKDGLTPASLVSDWTPAIDASNKLTVPAITMDRQTTQFDFSYSDIKSVDVAANGFDPTGTIELPLHHLFSALALTIQNVGEDEVTIKSITLEGINNRKSAEVNYAGSAPSVRYEAQTGATSFLANMTDKDLSRNTKLDLYTGEAASSTPNHILMWPQTADEIKNAKFIFEYTMAGVYSTEEGHQDELQVIERELKFTETGRFVDGANNGLGLDAGKKYAINILFKGKTIELELIVMPWDYQTFDIDYSSSSISANNANGVPNDGVMWLYTWGLDVEHNTHAWLPGDRDTRTVTMESGQNIKGSFYIGTPHSGRWQLTMYPAEAAQYFKIEPSSGQITEDLISNKGLVEFLVKPNGPVPSQQTVHFNLSFQFNGESQWRDGNSEFNRKDWKIVREP